MDRQARSWGVMVGAWTGKPSMDRQAKHGQPSMDRQATPKHAPPRRGSRAGVADDDRNDACASIVSAAAEPQRSDSCTRALRPPLLWPKGASRRTSCTRASRSVSRDLSPGPVVWSNSAPLQGTPPERPVVSRIHTVTCNPKKSASAERSQSLALPALLRANGYRIAVGCSLSTTSPPGCAEGRCSRAFRSVHTGHHSVTGRAPTLRAGAQGRRRRQVQSGRCPRLRPSRQACPRRQA